MAYVTATRRGGYEFRESQSTPKGPRSRTLATFNELTDEVIEKARARATKTLSAEELRAAALRAGVPGARDPVERAARELIAELGKGRSVDPRLRHLLLDLLRRDREPGADPPPASDAGRAVAEWMDTDMRERGRTLVDLLLLTDALPRSERRDKPLRFPRLDSTAKHG